MIGLFFLTPFEIIGGLVAAVLGLGASVNRGRNLPKGKRKKGRKR
jgi:hypothetical protein